MLPLTLSPANSTPPTDLRQVLEQLYEGKNLYHYEASQVIQLRPDDIWVVCRGVVQLSTLYPNGDEALLGLVAPSMPFGLPLTFTQPYQATALSSVDLMRLNLMEVHQSPSLAIGLFQQTTHRLRQTEALLALMGQRRVRDRLCQLLLLLKQEIGHAIDGGTRLSVRLTHQHLANAIGTTRVTVTRLLGQLKEEGWLRIDRHHYIVLPDSVA